ncbi:universal stress protein [Haloarchaeobius sp. TZWWS8]|uniref:universal stress protein n=1 Tax=Haloarchaeobius sp. TZWWS8 TaxID=3446121 RepID=UPI003EB8D754
MFERIVIAADGSDCATRAARLGVAIAAKFGSHVTAVTAVSTELDEADVTTVLDTVESFGDAAGVSVEKHVVTGHPATAIVDIADRVDADTVVMGRQGHTGMRKRVFGSVTRRVLRTTERHVLTVPEGDIPVGEFRQILVPTDQSASADVALAPAFEIARRYGARVHLLTVVDVRREAGPFSAGGVDREYVQTLLGAARDELVELAEESAERLDGLDVELATEKGAPSAGIGKYVEENDIDLIVMASTGESRLTGQLLGGTTSRVLRTAEAPVLVVHPAS